MARKKAHPSRWLVGFLGFLVADGIYMRDWRPSLAGVGGIAVLICLWLAFRMTVKCDVKNHTKPGFCTRDHKGMLFGCQDHGWDKVFAWSRYLGVGYFLRWLNIEGFPIMRFQAQHVDRRATEALDPCSADLADQDVPELATLFGNASGADQTSSVDRQVVVFYMTAISTLATVVGTVATVIELAHS